MYTPEEIVAIYVETRDVSAYDAPGVLAILHSLKNNCEEDPGSPGGFVTSVLCNDLLGASTRADRRNMHHLSIYARFVDSDLDRAKLMAFREKYGR